MNGRLRAALLKTSIFVPILVFSGCINSPAHAYFPHGSGTSISTLCPKGTGLVDLAGNPDECASSTPNGSYQWKAFFDDARQSGQSAYFYNDSTLNYNVPCIDDKCGYDTTKLLNDPKNLSFSASAGSISSGVLTINPADLDTNGGNVAVGQDISYSGVPTTHPIITAALGSNQWQLDQNLTVASTGAITGQIYRDSNCTYQATWVPTYGYNAPAVHCSSTSATQAVTMDGYDWTAEGGSVLLYFTSGYINTGLVTITNGKFGCNSVMSSTSSPEIAMGLNTRASFVINHNQFDAEYPTYSGCKALGNFAEGTSGTSQTMDIEWNAFLNQGVLPMSGIGKYTYLTIANNLFDSLNLSGAFHGAIYANSLDGYMYDYIYKHNTVLYPSTSPAALGTTALSILSLASATSTEINNVEFLGNIVVTNTHNGVASPCSTSNTVYTVQTALWSNVGVQIWDHLTSKGNLVDPTGANGCGVFHGGITSNIATASEATLGGNGKTTVTVTAISGRIAAGGILHVNNTPYTWNGTITYNNDGATGSLVLDAPNTNLAAGMGVAGIVVPPEMYISAKTDSSHFTVKNTSCSFAASCTSADLTAAHQAMYSAMTVLPYGTVDPATGLASTGTGFNTGTYVVAGEANDISRSTYSMYNPTIPNYPPDVNTGEDHLLTTGAPTYIGGKDWSSGITP